MEVFWTAEGARLWKIMNKIDIWEFEIKKQIPNFDTNSVKIHKFFNKYKFFSSLVRKIRNEL